MKLGALDAFLGALVVWVLTASSMVASEGLRPKTYPAPKPQAVALKDQDRIALRWSCDTIRYFAEGKSKEQLEQAAKAKGLTAKERAEAASCLKKERKT